MGIEWYLVNKKDHIIFELGKGGFRDWFQGYDSLDHDLLSDRELFIEDYVTYTKDYYSDNDDISVEYLTNLANKLFDFCDKTSFGDLEVMHDEKFYEFTGANKDYFVICTRYALGVDDEQYRKYIMGDNENMETVLLPVLQKIDFTLPISEIKEKVNKLRILI